MSPQTVQEELNPAYGIQRMFMLFLLPVPLI